MKRNRWLLLSLLFGLFLAVLLVAPAGNLATLSAEQAFLTPGLTHPFGTDDLGRDMLLAVLQGARTSLLVAFISTGLAVLLGILVGLAAGLGSEPTDEVLMRLADIVLSIPVLLFAIMLAALYGGSTENLAILLGCTRWPLMARLVRAEALSLRRRDFIRAAIALGTPLPIIACRHIMPHAAVPAFSAAGIIFGGAIMAEATLAFVGLGDPRSTSWGQLVSAGFLFVTQAWWMWAFPAAAITLTSAMFAMVADPRPIRG